MLENHQIDQLVSAELFPEPEAQDLADLNEVTPLQNTSDLEWHFLIHLQAEQFVSLPHQKQRLEFSRALSQDHQEGRGYG